MLCNKKLQNKKLGGDSKKIKNKFLGIHSRRRPPGASPPWGPLAFVRFVANVAI